MSGHTCHLPGCKTPVPPRLLMCRPHWAKVPDYIQRAVYAAYRPGQERDKSPSKQWVAAAQAAIAAVQLAEGGSRPEFYCSRCQRWARKEVRKQPEIPGDATHSIPALESVVLVHGDDGTPAGKAYCERLIISVKA